jgi:hypothetical protein
MFLVMYRDFHQMFLAKGEHHAAEILALRTKHPMQFHLLQAPLHLQLLEKYL